MARTPPPPPPPRAAALLLLLLLLISHAPPSQSLSYSQIQNLLSLSHSLARRVALLRASRGDRPGAARARAIAARLEGAPGLWRSAWSLGWDYVRNYAWRGLDLAGAAAEVGEVARWLGELGRAGTEAERAVWVGRNYQRLVRAFGSLLRKLLRVFSRSGPLREMVKMVQKEVVEGGLLKDCIEIGTKDLNGLFQIFKDMTSKSSYSTSDGSYDEEDDDFRDL